MTINNKFTEKTKNMPGSCRPGICFNGGRLRLAAQTPKDITSATVSPAAGESAAVSPAASPESAQRFPLRSSSFWIKTV